MLALLVIKAEPGTGAGLGLGDTDIGVSSTGDVSGRSRRGAPMLPGNPSPSAGVARIKGACFGGRIAHQLEEARWSSYRNRFSSPGLGSRSLRRSGGAGYEQRATGALLCVPAGRARQLARDGTALN